MGTIYLIENNINKKCYIGLTQRTVVQRWREHLKKAYNDNKSSLSCAIRLYGHESFNVRILEENVQIADLADHEVDAIARYGTYTNGYNMTIGGDGVVGHSGWHHSDKAKLAISKANSGKVRTNETREIIKNSVRESFLRNATPDKISKATKIALARPEVKARLELNNYSKIRKRVEQLTIDGVLVATYKSAAEASRMTGTNKGNLCACCRGCFKQAGGYMWRYLDDKQTDLQYLTSAT